MDQTACCYVVTTLEIVYALDLLNKSNDVLSSSRDTEILNFFIHYYFRHFNLPNFFSEIRVTRIEFPLAPKETLYTLDLSYSPPQRLGTSDRVCPGSEHAVKCHARSSA